MAYNGLFVADNNGIRLCLNEFFYCSRQREFDKEQKRSDAGT